MVLCSGKVYYDLLKYRDAQKITEAALIRVEQLYPFHEEKMREVVGSIPERCQPHLVPGRTAEHGRMEFHRAAVARAFRPRDFLRRAKRKRESCGGRLDLAQARAGAADLGSARACNAGILRAGNAKSAARHETRRFYCATRTAQCVGDVLVVR